MFLIVYPLVYMFVSTPISSLLFAIKQKDVLGAIGLSIFCASVASMISLFLGTPLAYILARKNFPAKGFIEATIDIPMVIPHPVIGIAILASLGKHTFIGKILYGFGLKIMGSIFGIIMVMTFVGVPFYINAARDAFLMVPERLEKVSRTLGASQIRSFFLITVPLSFRSILSGVLMCAARGISEFGAIVVIAYHPMVASVLIFEKFESYGLKSSKPIAVLLIGLCLLIFVGLRILTTKKR